MLKVLLCVCLQAVFFETVFTQCLPPPLYPGAPLAPGTPLSTGSPLAAGAPLAPPCGPSVPGGTTAPGGPLLGNFPVIEEYNALGMAPIGPLYGRVIGGNIILDTSAQYTPIGPAGISIFSDNLVIGGTVLVTGKLPFLGTVMLEGTVPAAGTSAVSYECGTGNIGIVDNGIAAVTGPMYENGLGLPGLTSCNNVGML